MRFRGKSIRRKIVALLLVPLVSLTALWAFATTLTGREANQLLDVAYIIDKVGDPVENTVRVIQQERRQTLIYLADPRNSDSLSELRRQRAATDRAVTKIKANAENPSVRDEMSDTTSARLTSLTDALDGLGALRRSVEKSTVTRGQALDFYNRLVDPCHNFLSALHVLEDVELDKQARALVGVDRAQEMLSREDALVVSALITRRTTSDEIRLISNLVANRTLLYETNLDVLPASEREIFEQYWGGPGTQPLREAEEQLIAAGPGKDPASVDAARWQEMTNPVLENLAREGEAADDRYQDRVEPAGFNVLVLAGIAGVLGFLALLVSLIVSVRVGRSLIRDLSGLRKEAHEVSGVRLPSVMRRLAAGEQVDVETEAPRLDYERDELGQVGQALNTLQRAAVEAAVKQAELRHGVAEVFVNLARRNQVLLHRQLTLLDTMERRTEDTDELADLFRLDHLTTRMRRHAEGLVILSGAAPSRQWRKPVQLMDVVRAAVAEVEDYERVEVRRLPRIGVGGPAVADLTHLVAELLENATVFSPPHTAVQVHGERVANGFTLEIHDRGLGMNSDDLLDANLRLAETPEFELSDTDRLGLFVVSRLAQRQNVRVSLQPSPYGGTTAIVFLPAALLTEAPETQGTGFRLDRQNLTAENGRGRADGRLASLSQVPTGLTGNRSVLDGPIELEPPLTGREFEERPVAADSVDAVSDLGSADLDDTESERGGIFRAREHLRDSGRGTRGRETGLPRGPGIEDLHEQHRQAADHDGPQGREGRGAEPLGFPEQLPRRSRKTPKLVADHGRRLDERGGAHPATEPTPDAPTPAAPAPAPSPAREQSSGPAPAFTPAPAPASRLVPPTPEGAAAVTPDENGSAAPLGGLPRRVRQASLAPQLKDAVREDVETPQADVPERDYERDAEEVRNRMASLQRGWQRGRQQNNAEDSDGTEDVNGPGDTTGTTPEGDGR
ncbi:Nitrate and nitrite sensing [Streptomyces sp. S4.7]|uniref:sensor histidine kinase n=1 Tax=Streptomyces sp. S4.7 TaxID=2705439 RepID=UPI00139719DF|nr:nitrate- and nitrite sensing domain-containing protein [Streptomyces sp. S4.7]QHY94335.1 Nitrate and nitrite sensing [Streptomyces sp. S4.7]